MSAEQLLLTFPRDQVPEVRGFVHWREAGPVMERIARNMTWVTREEAERSDLLIQPIPCTVVRDPGGRYHAFGRIRKTRRDLQDRITLVVGGHVEMEGAGTRNLELALAMTLRREMEEELDAAPPDRVTRLGLVSDRSGPDGGRHLAVLHEAVITGPVSPRPGGEFRTRGNPGPLCPMEISKLAARMDPWSRAIAGEILRQQTGDRKG